MIAVHDGFAVNQNVQIKDFQYKLNFGVLFNAEEIIAGKKATFVFISDLLLNENKIDVS